MALAPSSSPTSLLAVLKKYLTFIGPGVLVSVAYMDPGNYSTSVSSGAMYQYKLLFMIAMSNIFAVFLQCLCIKLGTVTGLDLAEMCRLHLPYWANLPMYVFAELAIIATDLAEVVGTAIALEILFGIPLLLGVLVTVLDVLVVLMAYHKDGSMKQTRIFEQLVSVLVLGTCVCFVAELYYCDFAPGSFKEIVRGFLPLDRQIFVERDALFLSCGIVGSTVMPHSLYLGSALVQPRLKDYDVQHGIIDEADLATEDDDDHQPDSLPVTASKFRSFSDGTTLTSKYKPSFRAINYCLNYSYTELVLSLFIIAVFVNSAILIVAGCTLYGKPDAEDADLLSIYHMLSYYISPGAGLLFAISMLFAGQSAGIVCTMSGQIISEGFINWSVKPWVRRIITRTLAIIPVVIVIGTLGREGVAKVMNSSQVVLSFILPIVSAPLIYFTCSKKYMTVIDTSAASDTQPLLQSSSEGAKKYTFENGTFLRVGSVLTWIIITFLNGYLLWAFAHGAQI
ncbi:hypothetical protein DIURU_003987 [Diutina rugosa]|uniref:Uncharacterized protein n=1 Tax=Diutina rugosa TaxID=5481 RepID=A0A642UND3_DIURU|nr:uncharacterized protein DIURU_003987 [Diutina rugosa]KAA8900039.1 hypothetical protein DIURU_003987 [Diutina rugosa]